MHTDMYAHTRTHEGTEPRAHRVKLQPSTHEGIFCLISLLLLLISLCVCFLVHRTREREGRQSRCRVDFCSDSLSRVAPSLSPSLVPPSGSVEISKRIHAFSPFLSLSRSPVCSETTASRRQEQRPSRSLALPVSHTLSDERLYPPLAISCQPSMCVRRVIHAPPAANADAQLAPPAASRERREGSQAA